MVRKTQVCLKRDQTVTLSARVALLLPPPPLYPLGLLEEDCAGLVLLISSAVAFPFMVGYLQII